MTHFINLRAGAYGALCDPYVLEGDAMAGGMRSTPYESIPALVKGKDVLLAAHGFNVGYVDGLRGLGRLETMLAPAAGELMFGVLWPGDWVIPAINFPFAENIASHAGQLLGGFCNRWLSGARSLSFLSHSLGARVVLETVAQLQRRAQTLCIAAGAIGDDCLAAEYQAATANCDAVVTLSSREDMVLALAFPIGDLIADILDDDHMPFERALGRDGPQLPYGPPVAAAQIEDAPPYGHGDYMPPADLALPVPDAGAKWMQATQFMTRAFRRQTHIWPA